jgi:ribonuclease VapC
LTSFWPSDEPRRKLSNVVLDSSAVLALLYREPGEDEVRRVLRGATIGTVNLCEVVSKLVHNGMTAGFARRTIDRLNLEMLAFSAAEAYQAGFLQAATRPSGLSLGDRACLALASALSVPAVTADRRWIELNVGVDIQLIR